MVASNSHELNSSGYLAGLGAGMVEAILAVTPSETIKYVRYSLMVPLNCGCAYSYRGIHIHRTKLIDDANSAKPRFNGLIHGTRTIVREEGIRGIYRGLFPVVSSPHSSLIFVCKMLNLLDGRWRDKEQTRQFVSRRILP